MQFIDDLVNTANVLITEAVDFLKNKLQEFIVDPLEAMLRTIEVEAVSFIEDTVGGALHSVIAEPLQTVQGWISDGVCRAFCLTFAFVRCACLLVALPVLFCWSTSPTSNHRMSAGRGGGRVGGVLGLGRGEGGGGRLAAAPIDSHPVR